LTHSYVSLSSSFTAAFVLLCLLHALLFASALRLPVSLENTTEVRQNETSMILETVE
jgi:hypothetical protein